MSMSCTAIHKINACLSNLPRNVPNPYLRYPLPRAESIPALMMPEHVPTTAPGPTSNRQADYIPYAKRCKQLVGTCQMMQVLAAQQLCSAGIEVRVHHPQFPSIQPGRIVEEAG